MVVTLSVFHPASQAGFADWAALLAASAADTEGCLGTDISTVTDGDFEPAVAATFVDEMACDRWVDSARRAEILREGRDLGWLPSAPALELVDGEAPPPGVGAFRHEIVPGRSAEFLAAQRELTGAASGFSGYEGTALFVDDETNTALSVLRFRTDRQLSAWVSSRERGDALDVLRSSLTHDFETMSATTAFGTTVRTDHGRIRQTPNWKSAMMVLLVLYPTVMILSRFLGPVLDDAGAEPWLALWLSQVVSVGLMQWWLMPWAAKPFRRWLDPVDGDGWRSNLAGAIAILAIYSACLALFANVTWLQFWDYMDA
ncbi:antibiotic biosynthesis monooxygenase [Gordonia alkanivorans]|uniref:antibiotic biosynthesis monooxygenase n=1 Tax=Gordonia alkanivorans TaxID=84096 RepID=UPI0002F3D133|nr:antibiotic biosynthesis monooxygenase [Gordonia alkanivorans]MDH3026541.1 antibiotic biosynthesis monooxygenase [Gordonia alkanivorans]MDH3052158.1 antibiotic biosynthesis monooxygenase [Gordonia alkanivorans]